MKIDIFRVSVPKIDYILVVPFYQEVEVKNKPLQYKNIKNVPTQAHTHGSFLNKDY